MPLDHARGHWRMSPAFLGSRRTHPGSPGKPDFNFREIWYAYGSHPRLPPGTMSGCAVTAWCLRPFSTATTSPQPSSASRPSRNARICTPCSGRAEEDPDLHLEPRGVAGVVASIKQYAEEHPDLISYSLCPDDNTDFCECEPCKALDPGHLDRGGLTSVADRYQHFLNQVLDGLKDTHPDLLVTTYSYNRSPHRSPRPNAGRSAHLYLRKPPASSAPPTVSAMPSARRDRIFATCCASGPH
jgi:hypothetical protein